MVDKPIQPVGPEPEPDLSLSRRFFNLRTLLSFGVAAVILAIVATRADIDFAATWATMVKANPFLYVAAFSVYYASFPLRGLRWKRLGQNVGFDQESGGRLPSTLGLTRIILLSWLANCIVPAKLGDAYRGYLLKKNANVSFSKTMGTILAERIMDMIILFALLVLSALVVAHSRDSSTAVAILEGGLVVVALILVGLAGMRYLGRTIERLLPLRVRAFYRRFEDGTLQSFQHLPSVILLTVAIWMCEAGRLYFIGQSLSAGIDLSMVVFVALANSLLTALPFTPGGVGLVEVGVTGLLTIAVSKESALAITALDRSISYVSVIVVGLLFYIITSRKR